MANGKSRLLRFHDLHDRGIVTNWPQLGRLIEQAGFPKGYKLGSHTRVWDEDQVERWLQARREAAEIAA